MSRFMFEYVLQLINPALTRKNEDKGVGKEKSGANNTDLCSHMQLLQVNYGEIQSYSACEKGAEVRLNALDNVIQWQKCELTVSAQHSLSRGDCLFKCI